MEEKRNWNYSPQEYAEKKTQEMQEAYRAIDDTTVRILADDSVLKMFLDMQTEMERYSIANLLLIFSQKPEASQIKEFDGWSKEEISIKRGEKGLSVLQPYSYQKNGQEKTGYKLKKVFDVSQTVAENPLPQEKNLPLKSKVLETLIDTSPVDIDGTDREEILFGKVAQYVPDENKIYIRKGMEPIDFMITLVEEISAVRLCSVNPEISYDEQKFGAECVTYMFCQQMGLETEKRTVHVPQSIKGLEPKDARKVLLQTNQIYRQMKKEILFPEKNKTHDRER